MDNKILSISMWFKNLTQIVENGRTPELRKKREDILHILNTALDSVNPYNAVKSKFKENKLTIGNQIFDLSDYNDIYLVGFGKASIGMAQAIADSIQITKGIIITNDLNRSIYNFKIECIVGSHPIPNENCIIGTDKILKTIEKCKSDDLLIILISGGGSALLCKPRVNLDEIQKTTELLLKCNADISEINTIRKHLSHVKGGQLIRKVKCKTISLIISDIIDDPIEFIASGPTSPD